MRSCILRIMSDDVFALRSVVDASVVVKWLSTWIIIYSTRSIKRPRSNTMLA